MVIGTCKYAKFASKKMPAKRGAQWFELELFEKKKFLFEKLVIMVI
jgi:hypothetical protein